MSDSFVLPHCVTRSGRDGDLRVRSWRLLRITWAPSWAPPSWERLCTSSASRLQRMATVSPCCRICTCMSIQHFSDGFVRRLPGCCSGGCDWLVCQEDGVTRRRAKHQRFRLGGFPVAFYIVRRNKTANSFSHQRLVRMLGTRADEPPCLSRTRTHVLRRSAGVCSCDHYAAFM
jgi:hypothetical protein